jgi:hypothetical protein
MRGLVANWLWLLVFGALALGFIIGGLSASKETPAQQQTERADNTKGGSDKKLPPVSQLHPEQETPKAEEKEKRPSWSWLSNFFELKLTDAIIAIFTIVLAVKTSGLFVETAGLREAAQQQREDSLRSIKAAEIASEAAQKSADTGERALFVAYRPLITIVELELRGSVSALGTPHIHFGIRNSGQGIAAINRFSVTIVLRGYVDSKMVRTTSITTTEWLSLIERGETASGHTVTTPTIQAQIADIWNGQLALYVTIEIEGQDFFLNRTNQKFPFVFDTGTMAFRRVSAGDEDAPRHGEEKKETEYPGA